MVRRVDVSDLLADHLSRHIWHGNVSVSLSAGKCPLVDGAQHIRMARGRRTARNCGDIHRSVGLVSWGGYVRAVTTGRRFAGGPGPACPRPFGPGVRLIIAALCYAQPLVRSWARYWTRLSSQRTPWADLPPPDGPQEWLSLTGCRAVAYWSEGGIDRTEILRRSVAFMDKHHWGKVIDTGWFEWDIAVYCDWGLILKIVTAQEEHGQGKRLIRIRYCLGPTASMKCSHCSASLRLRSALCPIQRPQLPPRVCRWFSASERGGVVLSPQAG